MSSAQILPLLLPFVPFDVREYIYVLPTRLNVKRSRSMPFDEVGNCLYDTRYGASFCRQLVSGLNAGNALTAVA